MTENSFKVGFIGAGTVGSALALKLSAGGYRITAASSRRGDSAKALAERIPGLKAAVSNQEVADLCDTVFITTPDDVIPEIATTVSFGPGQSALHCSGADSTLTLKPAREAGANVGVIHPLQTFASTEQAILNIPGSTFALEAEEPLLGTLKDMVNCMSGHYITLSAADKAAYHASAVIACNYLVTLVKLASDLWQSFDVPPERAVAALLPLIRGTIHNIETVGIPGCLTGPIARGDAGTIKTHLDALEGAAPQILPAYRALGLQTVPIARAKGKIKDDQADSITAMLQGIN